jgi:hypothetical protein
MRLRRPLIAAVLACAVLAGQWLAASHDPDHTLQAGAAHVCAVCVYAHGAGTGALPAMPVLTLRVASAVVEAFASASPLAAAVRNHPIRGPPQHLC